MRAEDGPGSPAPNSPLPTPRSPVCLGLDIGGGGTRAALGNPDGSVLGLVEAGGLSAAVGPLVGKVDEARWVVQVGLAGFSRPGRRAACVRTLTRLLPLPDIEVTSDAAVALWGALPEGEGVAVLAGTGSIALARASDGRQARAGGYGFLVGDEGSAFWLGREAVTAALAAAEGRGPATGVADLLCAALDVRDPRDLPARLSGNRRAVRRLADLAPLVSQAAAEGDGVGRALLAQAARALSSLAVAAARGVWADHPPVGLRVAQCGGVWEAGRWLVEPFEAALASQLPDARVVRPTLRPVGGALLLACRRAGGAGPEVVARLTVSLEG